MAVAVLVLAYPRMKTPTARSGFAVVRCLLPWWEQRSFPDLFFHFLDPVEAFQFVVDAKPAIAPPTNVRLDPFQEIAGNEPAGDENQELQKPRKSLGTAFQRRWIGENSNSPEPSSSAADFQIQRALQAKLVASFGAVGLAAKDAWELGGRNWLFRVVGNRGGIDVPI